MKVSFIVPVYNAQQYLSRCVKSILSIESKDIELILINDGSTDNSEELCIEFERNDKRVKFISQKNAGVSVARNSGLSIATGKYCFFLDADDYLVEKNRKILLKEVESDKDIICFNHICIYENGYKKEEYYSYYENNSESLECIKRQLLTTHMLHTCWGKLFKKDIIDEYDVEFPAGVKVGEDYIFVLEYCKHINSGKLINSPIVYYNINNTSVMQNFSKDARFATWCKLMTFTEEYYKKCGYFFDHEFYLYQFRTFTSMTRNIFLACPKKEIVEYMDTIKKEKKIENIVDKIELKKLNFIKKFEVQLIQEKKWIIFSIYFAMKAFIQRIRRDV